MQSEESRNVVAAVVEFHVHDLGEAIEFYGGEVANMATEGLKRMAQVDIGGEMVVLREILAKDGQSGPIA